MKADPRLNPIRYYVKKNGKYLKDYAHTFIWTKDKADAKHFYKDDAYRIASMVKGTTVVIINT